MHPEINFDYVFSWPRAPWTRGRYTECIFVYVCMYVHIDLHSCVYMYVYFVLSMYLLFLCIMCVCLDSGTVSLTKMLSTLDLNWEWKGGRRTRNCPLIVLRILNSEICKKADGLPWKRRRKRRWDEMVPERPQVALRECKWSICSVSIYVSIRQHTSSYVYIRLYTSAYVSIREHTSAYVSWKREG